MNNLTWSGNSPARKDLLKSEIDEKSKKKIDYKKEFLDLQKILEKLEEKYHNKPTNPVSGAIVDLRSCIMSLEKELKDNINFPDDKRGNK